MSPKRNLASGRRRCRGWLELQMRRRAGAPPEITRADWPRSLTAPNGIYNQCHRYFHINLPTKYRAHRQYLDSTGIGKPSRIAGEMDQAAFQKIRPAGRNRVLPRVK